MHREANNIKGELAFLCDSFVKLYGLFPPISVYFFINDYFLPKHVLKTTIFNQMAKLSTVFL